MRKQIGLVLGVLMLAVPRPAAATLDVAAQCDDDRDCAPYPENPWCDPNGSCYRCSENTDCTALDEVCDGGACVLSCVDDMDCTAVEPTCHPDDAHCVECIDDAGCLESEHCSVGLCVPDGCAQGETRCATFGSAVVICNAAGSGWDPLEACDVECSSVDGMAQCVAGETTSGGSTSADVSTGAMATDVGTTSSGGETAVADDDGSSATGEPVGGATDEGCGCRTAQGFAGSRWLLLVLFSWRRSAISRFSSGNRTNTGR